MKYNELKRIKEEKQKLIEDLKAKGFEIQDLDYLGKITEPIQIGAKQIEVRKKVGLINDRIVTEDGTIGQIFNGEIFLNSKYDTEQTKKVLKERLAQELERQLIAYTKFMSDLEVKLVDEYHLDKNKLDDIIFVDLAQQLDKEDNEQFLKHVNYIAEDRKTENKKDKIKEQNSSNDKQENSRIEQQPQKNELGKKEELGNINNEIKTNTLVSDRYTLGKLLGINSQIESLAIVPASKINPKNRENITSEYAIVGITKYGQVVDMSNELSQDTTRAQGQMKSNLNIETNYAKKDNNMVASFKVAGKPGLTLRLGRSGNTQLATYLAYEEIGSKESVNVRISDSKTSYPPSKQRNIISQRDGVRKPKEMNKEANLHLVEHNEKGYLENVDGDKNTSKDCNYQDNYGKDDVDIKFVYEHWEEFEKLDDIVNEETKRKCSMVRAYNSNKLKMDIEDFEKECYKTGRTTADMAKGKSFDEHVDDIAKEQKEKEEEKRSLEGDALRRLFNPQN